MYKINACVASGGWVPMGQGAATAIQPKAEEHPQAYQPATQPRAPPCPAPHYRPNANMADLSAGPGLVARKRG